MHPRRRIRDFVGAALNAHPHMPGKPVGVGRVLPLPVRKLPSIEVYTGTERVTGLLAEAPRIETRVVDLRVEIVIDATTAQRAQDLLDDIAEQIEAVVLADETHGDVASRTEYRETTPSVTADGDRNVVGFVIGFDVTYQFDYGDRDLEAALRIGGEIDIESETEDQVEAEVEVDLDQ